MKLLEIFAASLRGGAEEYALTIATAAAQQGWEVHAAFPNTAGTASLIQDFQAHQVRYHALPTPQERRGKLQVVQEYAIQFSRTLALLQTVKPDVVLINLPWPDACFGNILACGLLQIPTLVVFHLIPFQFEFSPRKLQAYTWARSRHQQWLTISKHNQKFVAASFHLPPEEVLCVYNGTKLDIPLAHSEADLAQLRQEVRQELGLPASAQIALTVGRLHEQKGHQDLIPTIPHLTREFPDLRFVWVGDGKEKQALMAQAQEYGVTEQIAFLGYRSDVPRLLQASDLFVFPTYFEGQPFALLEAMAYGLPIVTSKASGIPEVIAHGIHGLLFRTGDRCELLETLRWSLRHPEEMRLMAENAQSRSQDFSQEKMLKETLEVLQKVGERC